MAAKKRWSELSESTRRLIVVGAVFDGVLRIAALADLRRRPPAQVRGRKAVWAIALLLVNSVGALPISYFAFGRQKEG